MYIPGFGSEELRPYKKAATTEAHKQVQHHYRAEIRLGKTGGWKDRRRDKGKYGQTEGQTERCVDGMIYGKM